MATGNTVGNTQGPYGPPVVCVAADTDHKWLHCCRCCHHNRMWFGRKLKVALVSRRRAPATPIFLPLAGFERAGAFDLSSNVH
jgi:hypothetical protein